MQAHRIDTEVAGDGSITIRDLPFQVGEAVEVIVLPSQRRPQQEHKPLRNSVLAFERPFESAAGADEWEAA